MTLLTQDQVIRTVGGEEVAITRDLQNPAYVAWLGEIDPEPSVESIVTHLQFSMDRLAKQYGYDDLKTAISYRGDPNPKFAAEAEGFFVYRSGVWTTAYAHLARVLAGEVTFPSLNEAIAMMPPLDIQYP